MLGAAYESPMGPREELKSPLRGGVTSNWKRWPSGRCSRATGESGSQNGGRGSGAAWAFVKILWCLHCTGRKLVAGCHKASGKLLNFSGLFPYV